MERVPLARGPDLVQQLGLLPASYLPFLCCIVCEQLVDSPLLVPPLPLSSPAGVTAMSYTVGLAYIYPPFLGHKFCLLRQLAAAIHNFLVLAGRSDGFTGPFAFLRSPSVVQFLKLVLILPEHDPSVSPNLAQCGTDSLLTLLTLELRETQAGMGLPLTPWVSHFTRILC